MCDSERKIEFTDEDFETEKTIRSVLELFVDLRFPYDGAAKNELERVRKIILFLQKYDCKRALSMLANYLNATWHTTSQYSQQENVYKLFVLGAMLDDIALCRVAMRYVATDHIWTKGVQHRSRMPILQQLTLSELHLVPLEYIWALTQAAGETTEALTEAIDNKTGEFVDRISRNFETAINKLKGECCRAPAVPANSDPGEQSKAK